MTIRNNLLMAFLVMLMSSNVYSQFGIGVGKGALGRSFYFDTQIPNHILIYHQKEINDFIMFKLNTGYGLTTFESKIESNSSYYDSEHEKNTTSGFPVEVSIVFKKLINDNDLKSNITIGVGAGYYYYSTERKIGDIKIKDFEKTSGLAQYISFGLEFEISKNLSAFLEFKKILFNTIEIERQEISIFGDDDNPDAVSTYSFRDNGVLDLGISFGMFF